MKRSACALAVTVCLLAIGPSAGWCQQTYLYAPAAVGSPESVQVKDGVLVQELTVEKGDTLYGISRKFSGHGSYYPQILLFNEIKDPNKIYPGEVFRIPVSRKEGGRFPVTHEKAAPAALEAVLPASAVKSPAHMPASAVTTETGTSETKKTEHQFKEKKRDGKDKSAGTTKKLKQHPVAGAAGQNQFESAIKAYRQDDFKTALELFDAYLAENPASPLAADASFYKAECYLKLSTKN